MEKWRRSVLIALGPRKEPVMTARQEHDGWKPIPQVADANAVPARTVYNWARAKKLEVRVVDGVKLVDPENVAALAGRRAATKAPASAGNAAGNGTGMASGRNRDPEHDGELSAKVFAALKRGEALEDIIERLRLPAPTALALYDQFEKVRAAAKSGPTILERVAVLEKKMAEVAALAHTTANEVASIWQALSLAQDMAEGVSLETARVLRPALARLSTDMRELTNAFNAELTARW